MGHKIILDINSYTRIYNAYVAIYFPLKSALIIFFPN